MKHERRTTPIGAALDIYRDKRMTKILVDRWSIPAMTPGHRAGEDQIAVARAVADRARHRLRLTGWRGDITWGCGHTSWHIEAPLSDESDVLDALFGIERGDFAPANAYIGKVSDRRTEWTASELLADDDLPLTARELLAEGLCSSACLLALADDGACDCRCHGRYHGVLADAAVRATAAV